MLQDKEEFALPQKDVEPILPSKSEEQFLFQVNLGGMIDILSNHLYSSPDVFVRELLQNAMDAIAARKVKGQMVLHLLLITC